MYTNKILDSILMHMFTESNCNYAWILDEENGITDGSLTASSSELGSEPDQSRFTDWRNHGWIALLSDSDPWIEADLEQLAIMSAVEMQGNGILNAWVTLFTIGKCVSDGYIRWIHNHM